MKLKYDITRMVQAATDFQQIELFMSRVEQDSLSEMKDDDGTWKVTQDSIEGIIYDVLGSLEQWCQFFQYLGGKYMPNYNDKPLRALISKIRIGQMINKDIIDNARLVIDMQRKLFMSVPKKDFDEAWLSVYAKQEA